jgi:L-amino acid N-acyltransferase YncA
MNKTAVARSDDEPVVIRASRESDVEAMMAIYRHHVRNGVPRDVEEPARRSRTICATGARI